MVPGAKRAWMSLISIFVGRDQPIAMPFNWWQVSGLRTIESEATSARISGEVEGEVRLEFGLPKLLAFIEAFGGMEVRRDGSGMSIGEVKLGARVQVGDDAETA